MADRRRINGPAAGTAPLTFASALSRTAAEHSKPFRSRRPNQHRKIFLKTGLTPSASGSAYLELQRPSTSSRTSLISPISSLKLSCTVHGPKPLPRSAPFSPQLVLSTHIKFSPSAGRNNRRGFVRDGSERDLGVHLETALRGVIIGDRWPKSGVDVTITVLEAEDEAWYGDGAAAQQGVEGLGMMSVLAGCITVASAAIVEAGIDCADTITGGVAALVASRQSGSNDDAVASMTQIVIDPCPAEHSAISAACVVGYLQSRDEVTEMWVKGDVGTSVDALLDSAVAAAKAAKQVLAEILKESMEKKILYTSTDQDGAPDRGQKLADS